MARPSTGGSTRGRRRSSVTPAAKEPEAKSAAGNGNETEKDAAIEEEEQDASTKTPAKTRGKRPRVSDVAEDAEATPATTRTLRPRAKSPAAETPARAPRGTKRPRVSAVSKPLKQGLNGLATPFASIDDPKLQHFTFKPPYSLLSELDPRKSENQPLSAFIFGTGDNGQFGLGVEQTDEIPRPRLHEWFKVNSVAPAQTNGSEENGDAEASKPKAKLGPHGIEQVACGGLHSLALDSEGKVWSWGVNDNGSLGRLTANPPEGQTTEDLETQPMLVAGLQEEGFRAVRIVAGDCLGLAIDDRGDVRAWGSFRLNTGEGAQVLGLDGAPGEKNIAWTPVRLAAFKGQAVYEMAAGDGHVIALTSDGHVLAYGNGESGQLGRKILARRVISGFTPERLALKKIVHVAAGSFHSFALDEKGNVYGWGLDQYRQTGVSDEDLYGDDPTVQTPTILRELDPKKHNGSKVVRIACGQHHSVFLFDNGEVYTVGRVDDHQLGLAADQEAMKELREAQREVERQRAELGDERTAFHVKEGMSEADARIQATYDAATEFKFPEFVAVPQRVSFPDSEDGEPTKIVSISAMSHHTLAVSSKGEVFGWGRNLTAQLGLGDETIIETPTRLRSKALKPFKVLSAATGFQHSMLLAGQLNAETAPAAA